jgi:chitinase
MSCAPSAAVRRAVTSRQWTRRVLFAAAALIFAGGAVAGPASGAQAAAGKAAAANLAAVASPGISAPPDVIAGEADGHVNLMVRLSAPGTSTVTVNYATADSTATGATFCNNAYVPASGTLTFPPGTTTKTVQVTLLDCHVAGFRSFTFNLATPSNATIVRASTRVGIVGDPSATGATPGLYVRSALADTSTGTVSVPVMLGGPAGATSNSTVTVSYTTHDGSAIAGTDYTTTSGKLTFSPGQTVKNIAVPILGRTGAAPARSFTVTLTSPANATVVNGSGVVTIGASGAAAAASPGISAPPDVIAGEADGYLDIPVTLSAPGKSTVTVDYATADSTAGGATFCTNAYVPVSGALTFTPGVTTKVIRIDLLDCHFSGFRSFTFSLTLPGNATITRPSTRVGIVGDPTATGTTPGLYARDAVVDTTAGTVSVPVMLGGPAGATSTSTVTVSYTTANGSAAAGTDYTTTSGKLTFGPGQTVKNITVPILGRTGAAPTRSFTVTLSKPTNATIVNGTGVVTIGASGAAAVASPRISAPPDAVASEAGGYLDVPVTLSAPGKSTVTVNYATADSTATGATFCNNAYVQVSGTLTFTPGVTTKVIRIDLLDCQVAGFRSFTFNLSTPSNATIIRPSTRVGIVGDPKPTGTTPGLYVRDAVVDTAAGTVSVPVMLGGPAGATSTSTVTVSYATGNGSATAGSDYAATSGKLTFGPGQTEKNITVPILGRAGAAPTRSFTVTLTKPANATIADNTGVVTIGASGATAVTSPKISAAPNAVAGEASGYLDVPVTLSAPGKSTVTVNYATANGTASGGTFCNNTYVPVNGTLTFTPGVTTQVIRIDLLSCGVAIPGTFTFNLTAPVNGTITRPTTTITIVQTPGHPGAPTHATAVAGHQSATVSFTAPNSDGGDPINSYTVTSTPGGLKATGPVSPITVTGLTTGVSYTFKVAATNSVGTGPKSKASNAVVPSAPVSVASLLRAHSVPVSVASLLRAHSVPVSVASLLRALSARG